jgi:hypothetical protein
MSYRDRFTGHVRRLAVAAVAVLGFSMLATVGPGTSTALAATIGTPAITVANGNSVIAAWNAVDGLYFFWNQYGTNNWNPETVAGPGTTFSSPSISVSRNTVIIAAQGPNDSLDFYWQQIDTSGWHAEQVAGAGTTFSAPSLTGNGGSVNIVAQGPSNSLDFYWQQDGATGWNPEVVAGAGTTMSAPSITANNTGPLIAAQGPLNSLYFYWTYDGSATWYWEQAASSGTTFSAPSIVVNNGSINLAAQGPGNSLDFYWQVFGSPVWHPEVVQNGTAFSQPALATWSYWAWNRAGEIYGVSIIAQGSGFTVTDFSAVDGSSVWDPAPVGTCSFCDFFTSGSPVTAVSNNEDMNVAVTSPDLTTIGMFWQQSSTDPDGDLPPGGPFNQESVGSISSLRSEFDGDT